MANFALPTSLTAAGGWTGSIADLASTNAAGFVSPAGAGTAVLRVALNDVADPGVDTGFSMTTTYFKTLSAGIRQDFTIALYQGATEIKTQAYTDIAGASTTSVISLTAGEAAVLTPTGGVFQNLELRLTKTQA